MSNVYKYKYIDKLLIKYNDLVNEINESEEIIKFYNINIGSDF
jgi:predicted RNase H-like nuclease